MAQKEIRDFLEAAEEACRLTVGTDCAHYTGTSPLPGFLQPHLPWLCHEASGPSTEGPARSRSSSVLTSFEPENLRGA